MFDKIDQLLTESRVIIPGAQALLGFQMVAILPGFEDNLVPHPDRVTRPSRIVSL